MPSGVGMGDVNARSLLDNRFWGDDLMSQWLIIALLVLVLVAVVWLNVWFVQQP
jgi:hypothetical protein